MNKDVIFEDLHRMFLNSINSDAPPLTDPITWIKHRKVFQVLPGQK